jgi:transcriptional regulator with XRE-family HTH domain
MTFAERLRELRDKAGLSQEALAQKAGMSVGTIRNYEQSVREPLWDSLFQLCRGLGVSCTMFAECTSMKAAEPAKKKAKK